MHEPARVLERNRQAPSQRSHGVGGRSALASDPQNGMAVGKIPLWVPAWRLGDKERLRLATGRCQLSEMAKRFHLWGFA